MICCQTREIIEKLFSKKDTMPNYFKRYIKKRNLPEYNKERYIFIVNDQYILH